MRTVEDWKRLLRAALREAMRAKEPHALSVTRETLAAIENAEAADLSLAPEGPSTAIAGAVRGLGAGDIARKELSPADATAIVERELRERRDSAATYLSLGRESEAAVLDRQADVLESLLVQDSARTSQP